MPSKASIALYGLMSLFTLAGAGTGYALTKDMPEQHVAAQTKRVMQYNDLSAEEKEKIIQDYKDKSGEVVYGGVLLGGIVGWIPGSLAGLLCQAKLRKSENEPDPPAPVA